MLLAGAGAPPATATGIFAGLAGEWTGRGTGRLGPDEPAEKVYCRIVNTASADGTVLQQSGRCAVGNTTGAVEGRIEARGGGRYTGTLASPAMRSPAAIAGTGTARRLDLSTRYEDSRTGRTVAATIVFRLVREGEYRMTTVASDPDTGRSYEAGDVVFQRR